MITNRRLLAYLIIVTASVSAHSDFGLNAEDVKAIESGAVARLNQRYRKKDSGVIHFDVSGIFPADRRPDRGASYYMDRQLPITQVLTAGQAARIGSLRPVTLPQGAHNRFRETYGRDSMAQIYDGSLYMTFLMAYVREDTFYDLMSGLKISLLSGKIQQENQKGYLDRFSAHLLAPEFESGQSYLGSTIYYKEIDPEAFSKYRPYSYQKYCRFVDVVNSPGNTRPTIEIAGIEKKRNGTTGTSYSNAFATQSDRYGFCSEYSHHYLFDLQSGQMLGKFNTLNFTPGWAGEGSAAFVNNPRVAILLDKVGEMEFVAASFGGAYGGAGIAPRKYPGVIVFDLKKSRAIVVDTMDIEGYFDYGYTVEMFAWQNRRKFFVRASASHGFVLDPAHLFKRADQGHPVFKEKYNTRAVKWLSNPEHFHTLPSDPEIWR